MRVNDPELLAEMTAAFAEYERALMADDLPAMEARLAQTRETEIATAIAQIGEIVRLRLEDAR